MSVTCTAKYAWTPDEYVTAMQRHYSIRFRNLFRILLKVTCALLLALALLVACVSIVYPYGQPAPYWSLTLISLICIYGLIYDRVNIWHWRRRFRRRPDLEGPTEWVFTQDGIETKTSLGEGTAKWKAFIKIVEVEDGFLFYSMEKLFSWIPFHSFDSMDCVDTVRNLIIKSGCRFIKHK